MAEMTQGAVKTKTVHTVTSSPQAKQKLSVGLIIGLILGSALVSIFYATSTYKTQT